jgi:hypothetical protein
MERQMPIAPSVIVWAVDYADFAMSAPVLVQLAVSIALTAGISVLVVWALHRPLLKMAQEPKRDKEDPSPTPPESYHLSGRIIQVTSVGFVFLFTFTVGQFVLNYRSADTATHLEAQYFSRALASASQLPAGVGRDDLIASLEEYRRVVVDEEWPLMQRGDGFGAYAVQADVSAGVYDAAGAALSLGASDYAVWDPLSTAIDEMLVAANDRLGDVPTRNAVSLVLVVIFLGIVSLAMTAAFQPARLRINLALIAIMGGTYGLLFYMVVELSNPFQGGGGIPPILGMLPP